jgi:hypothetical protein
MILGLRWMLARRADLAKRYLNEARRLALPFWTDAAFQEN